MASPLLTSPAPPAGAPTPRLDWIATSRQSHILGTPRWILKVPRLSLMGLLSRVVIHPRVQQQPLAALGGLLEPYRLLPSGRYADPATGREKSFAWGLIRARHAPEAFLDRRLARATPTEALVLMQRMLDVLATSRARGFHLVDCILGNFVVEGERVRIADPGLLVPARMLREPTLAVTSRCFARRMAADHAAGLTELLARHPHAPGREALQKLIADLPPRFSDWCRGRVTSPPNAATPQRVHFAPAWLAEVDALVRQ